MSLGNPDGIETALSSFTVPDPLPEDEDPEDEPDEDDFDVDELPPHAAVATKANANIVASSERNAAFISLNPSELPDNQRRQV